MKNLFTICLLMATTITSAITVNAQNSKPVKEQTKEETLYWLVNYTEDLIPNLKENESDFALFKLEFNQNEMKAHREIWRGGSLYRNWVSIVEYKNIYLQAIHTIEFRADSSKFWKRSADDVSMFEIKTIQDQVNFNNEYKSSHISIPFFELENKKGSKKDVQRIITAIMHMAKLSGAKDIPTVSKNTF